MSEEKKPENVCDICGGSGYVIVPEHDPRCDGSCKAGCPVPVQVLCDKCKGLGHEPPDPIREKLLAGIRVDKDTGCWIWTKGTMGKGYGKFEYKYKRYRAHRTAYELYRGPIPAGKFVCHTCDVKRCCNPDHLYIGDNSTNMNDAYARGQKAEHRTRMRGENNPSAKLNEADVLEIREDPRPHRVISNEYGICYEMVGRIKNRRKWAWL